MSAEGIQLELMPELTITQKAVAKSKPQRKRKVHYPAIEPYHKGWRVMGVAPDRAPRLRASYAELVKQDGPTFQMPSFEQWVSGLPKRAIHPKPFATQAAAIACAELARKGGWIAVAVIRDAHG